jgi:hypothetical protein
LRTAGLKARNGVKASQAASNTFAACGYLMPHGEAANAARASKAASAVGAAEACPYANICEQCDNYVTAPEFIPQLQAQLADVTALRDDATQRGRDTRSPGTHASLPASRLTFMGQDRRRDPGLTGKVFSPNFRRGTVVLGRGV